MNGKFPIETRLPKMRGGRASQTVSRPDFRTLWYDSKDLGRGVAGNCLNFVLLRAVLSSAGSLFILPRAFSVAVR